MIVLDTHAWIWWTSDPARLGRKARRALEGSRGLGLAAISCWELAMLASRGRITLDRGPAVWMEQSLAEHGIELLPLTPAVAARSAQLGDAFQGDSGFAIEEEAARLIYDRSWMFGRMMNLPG